MQRAYAELSGYRDFVEARVSEGASSISNLELGYKRSDLIIEESQVAGFDADARIVLSIIMGRREFSSNWRGDIP